MLREASDHFLSNNFQVTLVGRDQEKLSYFTKKYPEKNIEVIVQDYRDTNAFIGSIKTIIGKNGAYEIIVCWIHSDAANSLLQLIDLISNSNPGAVFYHIKGISSQDLPTGIDLNSKLDYREIYLGFKRTNDTSRWLTHHEISSGIIEAVVSDKNKFVVGQTVPRALMP